MAPLAMLALLAGDPALAASRWRSFVVLNQSNAPIIEVHVAKSVRSGREIWGPDLLGFADVIDVDEGREFKMKLDPQRCAYDVRANYEDGYAIILRKVNLCTTDRVSFK